MTAPDSLEILEAEERYTREKLALYRAKAYGSRPTSDTRLHELERRWASAAERLKQARAQAAHGA
jgi:hypothetical protein